MAKDVTGFLGGLSRKEPPTNAGDIETGLVPGLEDPLEQETATCSCLENPTDRGAWQAPVHGVSKGQT